MVRMSVAICTHNRAATLYQTIRALCVQNIAAGTFDVMVIDNASTDDTRDVVKSFDTSPITIRYIHEPRQGLSHARNRALAEVQAPLIAYLDDDTIPEPQWAASILNVFDTIHPPPTVVGGPVMLRWHSEKPAWMQQGFYWVYSYFDNGDEGKYVEHVYGGNMCFQTDVLRLYRGFDSRLGRSAGKMLLAEETTLQDQLREAGHTVYYQPHAIVWHIIGKERQQPKYVMKRYYGAGQTQALTRFMDRWPGRYAVFNIMLRQLYYRRTTLIRYIALFFLNRLHTNDADSLMLRCSIANFLGFETQLMRLLINGGT